MAQSKLIAVFRRLDPCLPALEEFGNFEKVMVAEPQSCSEEALGGGGIFLYDINGHNEGTARKLGFQVSQVVLCVHLATRCVQEVDLLLGR